MLSILELIQQRDPDLIQRGNLRPNRSSIAFQKPTKTRNDMEQNAVNTIKLNKQFYRTNLPPKQKVRMLGTKKLK